MEEPAAGSGAAASGEPPAEEEDGEEEEEPPAETERKLWRQNAAVLYDLFVGCTLEWPALTVAWLPDEPDEGCRLAIGLHTDGSVPNEVIVAELDCSVEGRLDVGDPWRSWQLEGFGAAEGFGCSVEGGGGPLRPLARMAHPTEVNCVAPCPRRPQLLATKAATGTVLLFDYKAERPAKEVRPDAQLVAPGPAVDGFALGWSPLRGNLLASGGNDGRLCTWDIEAALKARPCEPLQCLTAHKGAVCDLVFSRQDPSVLASVGDDGLLCLWDSRAGSTSQLTSVVSRDEVLAVDWSFHWERTVATAGKDREVRVWDLRSPATALHTLSGHRGDAVSVRWAPFREALLASGSADTRLNIWDLSPQQADKARQLEQQDGEVEAPELLFAHGGHEAGVSGLAWSDVDDFLLCSVAEDNSLQIWQPSTVFYLADSDGEGEEADDGEMLLPPPACAESSLQEPQPAPEALPEPRPTAEPAPEPAHKAKRARVAPQVMEGPPPSQ
uniref:Histone-binding protein RBBP4-like N-terminal domain-containing protein n=1 Tax=Alexandrium monilatum TaxID=311494 RepID=A0A7S4UM35_9DINO